MKKITLLFSLLLISFALLLFSLLFIGSSLFGQGSWQQRNSFPGNGKSAGFSFSINGTGYIGCGYNGSGPYTNDFWQYSDDVWTQKANFGGGVRYTPSSFVIDTLGYVCCGYNGQCMNDVWVYNQATNTWTQKNNFPGQARYGAFSFSIGNKGYMGMGSIGGPPFLTDFWEYNSATDTWTQKVSYNSNIGRIHGIGFTLNNKGYAGLGTDDGNGHFVSDFWEYDPLSNSWTQKTNFPSARANAISFVISNTAYVGAGEDNNGFYNNDFWVYNHTSNSWNQIATPGNNVRAAGFSFTLGNKGYIGLGGNSLTQLNDFWEFSPQQSSVTEISEKDMAEVKFDLQNKTINLSMKAYSQNTSFMIYTMMGQLVANVKVTEINQVISINQLTKGTYIYSLSTKDKNLKSAKFIVF